MNQESATEVPNLMELIYAKLTEVKKTAQAEYLQNKKVTGIGFCAIDHLLPDAYAKEIFKSFSFDNPAWREMDSFREKKMTTKKYDQFNPLLKQVTFAFQDPKIIKLVEEITQIPNQVGDPHLYAGGLSFMREGDFLDPHIDNSHDQTRENYRRLNLLYYVTPDWSLADGGNLELWDIKVLKPITIESRFNRLVLMETHHLSWHSVSQVVKPNARRCCVSNYYFSKQSPLAHDYYHVTSFMGRPENKMKRVWSQIDNQLRSFVRKIAPGGLGKKDLYQPPTNPPTK